MYKEICSNGISVSMHPIPAKPVVTRMKTVFERIITSHFNSVFGSNSFSLPLTCDWEFSDSIEKHSRNG